MYKDGTEVYGFKYEHASGRSFAYIEEMDQFIGEVGTVAASNNNITSLIFNTRNRFAYPTSMIEENLVDKGPEIDLKELLTQIKSL
jgi:hypothetical protein